MEVTKVGLMKWVIGNKHFLAIDDETVEKLRHASEDVIEIRDIEQKFDILFDNFIEFEAEISARIMRDAYRGISSAEDFFDDRLAITRRVANLLSSARLYVDQVKHHLSKLFPDDELKKQEVNGIFSEQYDTLLGYRAMESMRNYAQHRGLPVHGMSFNSTWVDDDLPTKRMESNATITVVVEELKSDPKFKPAVAAELEAMGAEIDLKPLVREYVEGLANAHAKIRELLSKRLEAAEQVLTVWWGKFAEHSKVKNPTLGLVVGHMNEDGTAEQYFSLSNNPLDYLRRLRSRSRSLGNLSKRTISTRVISK